MNNRRLNDFAIAAFVLGVLSFVQIFGMEKAIAAIVFGGFGFKANRSSR